MTVTHDARAAESALTGTGTNAGHPLGEHPLPFWLAGPCPPWCDSALSHSVRTPYRERIHMSRGRVVLLASQDPGILGEDEGVDGDLTAPAEISMTMSQHYREVAPYITLILGEEPRLTLGEAGELAAAIMRLVATAGEGTRKAADTLPWWQAEQCPAWCASTHENDDFPGSDRDHMGACHYVELTMEDAVDGGAGGYFQPYLAVELEQGWRETEARVLIQYADEWTSLTLAEAREAAGDLAALLCAAREGAGSEVAR